MGRSAETRETLLEAARTEFARHGLAGSRVDRIAQSAGVNKERIYGLFGSKDGLFNEVLIQAMRCFVEVVNPLETDGTAAEYVKRHYEYHRDHPELLRLLLWEALEDGRDAPRDIDNWRHEYYRDKADVSMARFGAADKATAARLTFSLCALASWPNAVPQLRDLMLGDVADDEEALERFLLDFSRRATAEETPSDEASSVDEAVAELERAQRAERQARERLARTMRRDNRQGVSANRLARQARGVVSRPVVLRMLSDDSGELSG
ncbi:TetR/AcrR family transcriptional regulator [Haloglycomyces albus]|uniref:TetR/AcrR family transcriptional regulator n=1 Tax=Haloglycomyces albus TaxID=526067 RepID=UPI00046D5ED6|nr:TetR/AcrR family transcriptional regulator [Haloglycomyces albus]